MDKEKIIKSIYPNSINELELTARPELDAEESKLNQKMDFPIRQQLLNVCIVIFNKQRIGDLSIGDKNLA
eukprot:8460795-Ditylum_brightwellii.AAC.1